MVGVVSQRGNGAFALRVVTVASTLGYDHGPVKREPGAFRAVKKSRVQCNGGWVWVKEGMRTACYQQTEKQERS